MRCSWSGFCSPLPRRMQPWARRRLPPPMAPKGSSSAIETTSEKLHRARTRVILFIADHASGLEIAGDFIKEDELKLASYRTLTNVVVSAALLFATSASHATLSTPTPVNSLDGILILDPCVDWCVDSRRGDPAIGPEGITHTD